HHARPAPGYDRPALLGEDTRDLARVLVRRVAFADACRPEDRDRGAVDPVNRLEALAKLVRDQRNVLLELGGRLIGREDPLVFHATRPSYGTTNHADGRTSTSKVVRHVRCVHAEHECRCEAEVEEADEQPPARSYAVV